MEASTHSRTMAASSGEVAGDKQRTSRYVAVHAIYHTMHLGTIKMLLKWGHKWRLLLVILKTEKCANVSICCSVWLFLKQIHSISTFLALELSAPNGSHAGLLFINEEQKKVGSLYNICFCHTCRECSQCHRHRKTEVERHCSQLRHLQTLISNKADQKSNGNCWVCFHSIPIIKGCDISQLGGAL